MIKPNQIKAARSLIGWSQGELADRSDLANASIQAIESDRGKPKAETLETIRKTFEHSGVYFTDNGVELRNENSYEISGQDWWPKVLDDVYLTLMDKDDAELLIMYGDDRESSEEVNNRIRKLRNAGIKMRQLIGEGNYYMLAPAKEYKWVPKEFFLNNVTLIYGDKICVCAENNTKALVVRDKAVSNSYKNTFEMLWCGIVPKIPDKESTANGKDRF